MVGRKGPRGVFQLVGSIVEPKDLYLGEEVMSRGLDTIASSRFKEETRKALLFPILWLLVSLLLGVKQFHIRARVSRILRYSARHPKCYLGVASNEN